MPSAVYPFFYLVACICFRFNRVLSGTYRLLTKEK